MKTIHAHDHLIREGQKTVTAVCFLRVPVGDSVIITDHEQKYDPAQRAYNCSGCIAVIEDRARDAASAPVKTANRAKQRKALERVQNAQRKFWDAIRALELTGISEDTAESIEDWTTYDLEALLAMEEANG